MSMPYGSIATNRTASEKVLADQSVDAAVDSHNLGFVIFRALLFNVLVNVVGIIASGRGGYI